MLTALFSRSDTGLLKTDATPTSPLGTILGDSVGITSTNAANSLLDIPHPSQSRPQDLIGRDRNTGLPEAHQSRRNGNSQMDLEHLEPLDVENTSVLSDCPDEDSLDGGDDDDDDDRERGVNTTPSKRSRSQHVFKRESNGRFGKASAALRDTRKRRR